MNLSKALILVALITLNVLLVLGQVAYVTDEAGEVLEPNVAKRHPLTLSDIVRAIIGKHNRRAPPSTTNMFDSGDAVEFLEPEPNIVKRDTLSDIIRAIRKLPIVKHKIVNRQATKVVINDDDAEVLEPESNIVKRDPLTLSDIVRAIIGKHNRRAPPSTTDIDDHDAGEFLEPDSNIVKRDTLSDIIRAIRKLPIVKHKIVNRQAPSSTKVMINDDDAGEVLEPEPNIVKRDPLSLSDIIRAIKKFPTVKHKIVNRHPAPPSTMATGLRETRRRPPKQYPEDKPKLNTPSHW